MNEDSFYSIDRLIEFGMVLAIEQQMLQTMNYAIRNMHISVPSNQFDSAHRQNFYVMIAGKQAGPFSEHELSRLIAEQKVKKETDSGKPGMVNWEIAEKLPEILKLEA